jgi:hypothetical protein
MEATIERLQADVREIAVAIAAIEREQWTVRANYAKVWGVLRKKRDVRK